MWKVIISTGTTYYPRKQAALEAAQSAALSLGWNAEVFDPKGRIRFRYWRDSAGLQYIRY